ETSSTLKTFLTGLENQLSLKVKVIRSDNGTNFKNSDLNQFCELNGIKREFSVPRTPQQNGIAERKNRTLIKAARTMLADSLLPIPFWAEAVNTACYTQNRVTNTFSAAGPSNPTVSPTYEKYSSIDASTLPHDPNMPDLEDFTYSDDEDTVSAEADQNNLESSIPVSPIPTTRIHKDHPVSQIIGDLFTTTQTRSMTRAVKDEGGLSQMFDKDFHTCMFACFLSQEEPKRIHQALKDPSCIEAMQEELLQFKMKKVWALVDLPYGKRAIGTNWVYRNKKDKRGIVIRNKERLVTQGHTQEEGIDYKEVFAPEEVYVCQPSGFEDPDYPDKVYKVVKVKQKKDGIFISQDKYVAEILRKFGLTKGKSASTPIDTEKPLLKDPDGEDVDCKKQTVVATSSMEAEYVAAASGCCSSWNAVIETIVIYILSDDSFITQQMVFNSPCLTHKKEFIYHEGMALIIDFLNDSYIKYALSVNPHIYVSCIKQFWNTVTIKQSNDVTRLQALVDRTKEVLKEAVIRDVLRLDDAEGAFFLTQWKFLIHTLLQSLSAKRTSCNEFSSAMASAAVYEQSIPSPTQHTQPPQPPQDIPSTSSVQHTQPSSPQPQPQAQPQAADFPLDLLQTTLDACAALTSRIKIDTSDDTIMEDVSNQGRMIDELDKDEGVAFMGEKEEEKKYKKAKDIAGDDQEDEPAEVEEVVEVVTTAKLITEVVTATSKSVSAAGTTIPTAEPQVLAATPTVIPVRVAVVSTRRRKGVVIKDPKEASIITKPIDTKSKDKGKGKMIEEPKPMKKKQHVELDEEYARKLHEELNKDIDWDTTIEHVKQKAKEDLAVLDYFKGMSYDDIRLIFEAKFNTNIEFLLKSKEQIEDEERRAIESINETPAQKAAKRRKLNEEVAELNKHLEIVPDEDDDLSVSLLTLLKNFDRDDMESLWSIVKERFSTTKPDNFTDDFLLTTLGAMFEKADDQAQI
nr:hypothetical protein [Tanacetum cinerariifolium]